MKKVLIFAICLFCIPIFSYAGDISLTNDGKVPGQPFQHLQKQIDQLKDQVAECCKGFYADPSQGTWTTVIIGTDFPDLTEIQRIPSLPKGKYVANAMVALASQDPTQPHDVVCYFKLGGELQGSRAAGVVPPQSGITLPLTTAFTIDEDQDLAVGCWADAEVWIFSQKSPITLIRVNKLKVYEGDGLED